MVFARFMFRINLRLQPLFNQVVSLMRNGLLSNVLKLVATHQPHGAAVEVRQNQGKYPKLKSRLHLNLKLYTRNRKKTLTKKVKIAANKRGRPTLLPEKIMEKTITIMRALPFNFYKCACLENLLHQNYFIIFQNCTVIFQGLYYECIFRRQIL